MKLAINITRWIARVAGILVFLFFVWFAIKFGGPSMDDISNQELKLFIANILMLSGLIVVWRFELIGSILLIGSYLFFSVVNNSFWIGPAFGSFIIIGIVHLICWTLTAFTSKDKAYFNYRNLLQ